MHVVRQPGVPTPPCYFLEGKLSRRRRRRRALDALAAAAVAAAGPEHYPG